MNCTSHSTGLAAIAVVITLAAGCADNATTTEPSNDPSPKSTTTIRATPPSTALESSADAAQALLDAWAAGGRGGVAAALAGDDQNLLLIEAGTEGPDGGKLEPDAAFRVGSLSKTFVAVMLLQLVADATIGLDDLVTEHAPDLTIADDVTIGQLLAHRSGIPEHTDGELAPAVIADPAKRWTPNEVLDLVADQRPDFPPGEQFAYSNTNYIVAGLLLERLTGITLDDNLQSRIVEPLGLKNTYFAPVDARQPIGAFSASLPGGHTRGASYHALETAAGAAGALVSTTSDLATFIRALAHGQLIDAGTYAKMIQGLPDNGHTLGVFASDPPSPTGISNGGAIPGFIAYMQYDPTTEDLLVLLLNDDTRSPEQLGTDLLHIAQSA